MQFSQSVTNISTTPDPNSMTISQGLYGERVDILDNLPPACHVQNCRDGYQGYVPAHSLRPVQTPATHYVSTRASLLFTERDIKSPVALRVVFGTELSLDEETDDGFVRTDDGHFALKSHVQTLGQYLDHDIATVAEQLFPGAPYLWGGRSPDGCDCSGLVQMAAFATGRFLPRDSGMQESFLGHDVTDAEWQRSDLVFWPGHTGVMLDSAVMLHATAHSMTTIVEPLEDVVRRAGDISSMRRPGSVGRE